MHFNLRMGTTDNRFITSIYEMFQCNDKEEQRARGTVGLAFALLLTSSVVLGKTFF